MAQTSFSSLGSGIDFSAITDAIISDRSRPIRQLVTKQATFRSRVDALKQLNVKLISFSDAVKALSDKTLGSGKLATSSNANAIIATASNTASNSTANVEVIRLATSLAQASTSFSSSQSTVLANGAINATFELRKGGATTGTQITIDSSNNSLTGLRDAINTAKAGLSAQIVDVSGDGTQNQLVLNSTDTGSSGRVELVETSSTGTLSALNLRNLNPITGSFSELDSEIKISGLTINRSSNIISDAISGVTLNLKDVGTTKISINNDSAGLKTKLSSFVDAFNDLQEFINNQFKADDKGKATGILVGDSTLRIVQQNLREVVSKTATNNGGAFSNLSQIGITKDSKGKLSIDQTILNEKLSSSLGDIQALLSGKTDTQFGLSKELTSVGENLQSNVKQAITGFDSSIESIDKNILAQQQRLQNLRSSLTRQFSIVDAAIGQLNGQGTALNNVIKSLDVSSRD